MKRETMCEPACDVRREYGYYVIYCDGREWARVDSWAEVKEELDLLEQIASREAPIRY